MLWVLGFHIEIKKEIFKNLLVPNRKIGLNLGGHKLEQKQRIPSSKFFSSEIGRRRALIFGF